MVPRAMRRRLEEEEELGVDRISQLPDTILGKIVSLLPTKDGGRTQVLSSLWRDVWRSAPLNMDIVNGNIPMRKISGILSSHPGPGRRFSIPMGLLKRIDDPAVILDSWLQSPARSNLQELEFDYGYRLPPLPSSVHRFSSTLRVASFSNCGGFPNGDSGNALQLPVLRKLSLRFVEISDSSMMALLNGCPVLESLLLYYTQRLSCIRVVSATLRSLAVEPGFGDLGLEQVIIEDAPSLDRLLLIPNCPNHTVRILISSAPKLESLGPLSDGLDTVQFGTTIFQGWHLVSSMTLLSSVKVLALRQSILSLDVVINFMKCFPCLETLYIQTYEKGEENIWSPKYQNLIRTLDISLKKIVFTGYRRGLKSHVNFAKFFVLNARVLQSMIFEVATSTISSESIERQHRLLQTKDRASKGACFVFMSYARPGPFSRVRVPMHVVAHDLSTADPFVRINHWDC